MALRRSGVRVLAGMLGAVLAVACGDGGGGGGGGGDASCPAQGETFTRMNAATYAVVPVIRVGPGANDLVAFLLGTAFAVDGRLLATNAHVTQAFDPTSASYAFPGLRVAQVVAVQSGTGKVVQLLRAVTHPRYTGDPLASPDVGLFTTSEVLPSIATLGPDAEVGALQLGETLLLTGFPSDVAKFLPVVPGTTVPQATSLTGQITAFRNHDPTVQVTEANRDVIQHQAPTSFGMSGSPATHCGLVVGVNNAGTIEEVVKPDGAGGFVVDRVTAAANNFAVSSRYVKEIVSLFRDQAIQGFELPPPFVSATAPYAGNYYGTATSPRTHELGFTVSEDGRLVGTSSWGELVFNLSGSVDAQGNLRFQDDAPTQGYAVGLYSGTVDTMGRAGGTYAEGTAGNVLASWSATRR